MSITEEAIKALTQTEATNASNLALDRATPDLAGKGLLVLHKDLSVKDLEGCLPTRRRARGAMNTSYVSPFALYTLSNAGEGATVFISPEEMSATAVLNFGTPQVPGHCDNKTKVALKATAAYTALLQLANCQQDQRSFSEWLEEWQNIVKVREGLGEDSKEIELAKCIAAVRSVTVKAVQDLESTVSNFSQNRTASEEIAMNAKAETKLPPFLFVRIKPYMELQERTFVVRVSAITSRELPQFRMQILGIEQAQEDMANEFADVVRNEFSMLELPEGKAAPQVLIGDYVKAS